MLSKAKTLDGYKLGSLDGELGSVKEFYFDDRHWTIRYLVADTGTWLKERKVLISPYALKSINASEKQITVDLTKKQIEGSPALESHKPVSQQFEEEYYAFYGWPTYWNGASVWGDSTFLQRDPSKWGKSVTKSKSGDRHLRSTHEVAGYSLEALDGEIGHIEDFVIDDDTWEIRYLVVATKNWWPGKKVLVSPLWIERISWSESKVSINLSRETIQLSPEYTEDALVTRDYEIGLHRHYNRKGYWIDATAAV